MSTGQMSKSEIESQLNFKTLEWRFDHLRLIDQRRLPGRLEYFECHKTGDFIEAIKKLVVRGAPAIGCTAAYGLALAAKRGEDLNVAAEALKNARPTAVNLTWAIDRMMKTASAAGDPKGGHSHSPRRCLHVPKNRTARRGTY